MKTVKRFEEWSAKPENVELFFAVVESSGEAGKMAFRDACFDERVKVPYTLMHAYVHSRPELKARYEAILAAKADELVNEALDDVSKATDIPTAAVARVKSDVKLKVASKWGRERYGEKQEKGAGGITVLVDRSCGGTVTVGVQDTGGNKAVVAIPGAEASAIPAEITEEA